MCFNNVPILPADRLIRDDADDTAVAREAWLKWKEKEAGMNYVDNYGKFYKLLKLLPGAEQGDLGAAVYQREKPSTCGR